MSHIYVAGFLRTNNRCCKHMCDRSRTTSKYTPKS